LKKKLGRSPLARQLGNVVTNVIQKFLSRGVDGPQTLKSDWLEVEAHGQLGIFGDLVGRCPFCCSTWSEIRPS
jgi:hypothetical protein